MSQKSSVTISSTAIRLWLIQRLVARAALTLAVTSNNYYKVPVLRIDVDPQVDIDRHMATSFFKWEIKNEFIQQTSTVKYTFQPRVPGLSM